MGETKVISKDKQYRTRRNESVEIFSTDGDPAKIDGVVTRFNGRKQAHYWNDDGSSFEGCDKLDLLEVGVKHTKTIMLSLMDDGYVTVVDSVEEALEWDTKIVAVKKLTVTFTNGEGL